MDKVPKESKEPKENASASLIKSMGRPEDVIAFEQAMTEFFIQAADLIGAPRSLAIIYGVIFASPQPLCFADLDERLELSKGSISQGLRLLKEAGAIVSVEKSGDRKEYFEPSLELRKMVSRFLNNKVQKQLEIGSERLEVIKKKVPKHNEMVGKMLADRVEQLDRWQSKAESLMPVIKALLVVSRSSKGYFDL